MKAPTGSQKRGSESGRQMKTRHSLGLGVMETLADIGFLGPIAMQLLTKCCDVFNAEQVNLRQRNFLCSLGSNASPILTSSLEIMHLDHFAQRPEASIP
jgi:hypothetical protein